MGVKLKYISTCNLNHDLVEYPKGAVLEFDESESMRIELLDQGLIIPAKLEDVASAPLSKKVESYKSIPGEKAARKATEDAMTLGPDVNENEGEPLKPPEPPKDKTNEFSKRGYCRKCKKESDVLDAKIIKATNGRHFIKGKCAVCKSKIHAVCKKIIKA